MESSSNQGEQTEQMSVMPEASDSQQTMQESKPTQMSRIRNKKLSSDVTKRIIELWGSLSKDRSVNQLPAANWKRIAETINQEFDLGKASYTFNSHGTFAYLHILACLAAFTDQSVRSVHSNSLQV